MRLDKMTVCVTVGIAFTSLFIIFADCATPAPFRPGTEDSRVKGKSDGSCRFDNDCVCVDGAVRGVCPGDGPVRSRRVRVRHTHLLRHLSGKRTARQHVPPPAILAARELKGSHVPLPQPRPAAISRSGFPLWSWESIGFFLSRPRSIPDHELIPDSLLPYLAPVPREP